MRLYPAIRIAAAAAFGLLVACSDSTGPDGSRKTLGILQMELAVAPTSNPDPVGPIRWSIAPGAGVAYAPDVIEAPDTVDVNQPFDVTVRTIGPDGCWMADGIETAKAGRVIELTPWDRVSGAEVCTAVLSYLAHVSRLTLDQAGEWTLRAMGRRVRGNGGPDVSVSAERKVYVRPAI